RRALGRPGDAARRLRRRAAAARPHHDGAAAAQLRVLRPTGEAGVTEATEGRVAMVTGASRGLGRAMAVRLAADGHAVIVNYASNSAAADEVVAEITGAGGRAVAIKADVSDPGEVDRLFAEA